MIELKKYKSFHEKKLSFEHHVISDLDSLKNVLKEYENNENFIFRGVNNASYKMYSSLHRYFIERDVDIYDGKFLEVLSHFILNICKEKNLSYPIFQNIAPYFNKQDFKNYNIKLYSQRLVEYKILFNLFSLLQHYSGLSSLLDFSNNIYIALYFAQKGWDLKKVYGWKTEEYISLYICKINHPNCNKFNITNFDNDDINIGNIYANIENITFEKADNLANKISNFILFNHVNGFIYFPLEHFLLNQNIIAQEGCYISYKHFKNKPLEEYFENKPVICLDISKNLIPKVQKEILEPLSINENKLFPNIEKQIEKIKIDAEKLFLKM